MVTFISASGLVVNSETSEAQARLLNGEAERMRSEAAALAAKQELWRLRNAKQRAEALKRKAERAAKTAVQA